MSFKSNTSIAGVIGLALTLTGCSSMTASLTRELVDANRVNIHRAEPLSIKSPYRVKSTSILNGDENEETVPADDLQIISQGSYRDWQWLVEAPPEVAAAWRLWEEQAHLLTGQATDKLPVSPVLDWRSGMRRMYAVAQYLLGEPPLPLRAEIRLVPKGELERLIVTLDSLDHVPLKVAYWYPTDLERTEALRKERWEYMARAMAWVAADLSHVQLAAGSAAAPADGPARKIKNVANGFCWNYAIRSAFAAGAASLTIPKPNEASGSLVGLIANAQQHYPEDEQLTQFYGGTVMIQSAIDFFQQRGISRPQNGSDIRGINAVLGFCRAFTHYAGDIRTEPLPYEKIRISEFFPVTETDTTGSESRHSQYGGR